MRKDRIMNKRFITEEFYVVRCLINGTIISKFNLLAISQLLCVKTSFRLSIHVVECNYMSRYVGKGNTVLTRSRIDQVVDICNLKRSE